MADLGPLSPQTEASIDLYKKESNDYRRGYDTGWDDAYRELEARDLKSTPPWFRRFFWYPKESYDGEKIPWMADGGEDQWCNPIWSIRLWGGVLHIRYGWKARTIESGPCNKCTAEDKAWRDSHAS